MNVTIIGPWVVVTLEQDNIYKIGVHRLGILTEDNIRNSITAAIIKAKESKEINLRTNIEDRPSLHHTRKLSKEHFYKNAYDLITGDIDFRKEFYKNTREEIEENEQSGLDKEISR